MLCKIRHLFKAFSDDDFGQYLDTKQRRHIEVMNEKLHNTFIEA